MSRHVIWENEFVTLWYYPESKIIHHRFYEAIAGPALQSTLSKGMEFFSKYGADKWLSDDCENMALGAEDQEWTQKVWFPKMASAGWKYWAILAPRKITQQLDVKRLVRKSAKQGVRVKVFAEHEEAMTWLESRRA